MAAYRGTDYLLLDTLLGDEEKLVRQTARRFADERILPLIRDCFRDGRFPAELDPRNGASSVSSAPISKATAAPA